MATPPPTGAPATSYGHGGAAPPPLRRELLFFILQFLKESDLPATALRLETESRFFFDVCRFGSSALSGDWDGAEWYLSRFTNPGVNPQSARLFFEISKIKYLEALQRNDQITAEHILEHYLKPSVRVDPDLWKDLSRDHEELKNFGGDVNLWRVRCIEVLERLIETNPAFEGKLEFPNIDLSRVHAQINQCLNGKPRIPPRALAPVIVGSRHGSAACLDPHAPNSRQRPRPIRDALPIEANRQLMTPSAIAEKNKNSQLLGDLLSRLVSESLSELETLSEVVGQSQSHYLRLPDDFAPNKVPKLIYTNSGHDILALGSDAVHRLWKWEKTDGGATTRMTPKLYRPTDLLMINDIGFIDTANAVHCFAVSRCESYIMSTSGGRISKFDLSTFKATATFMEPPPAITSLALHPNEDNIIAIGMEDSSILIYDINDREPIKLLKGHHQKRVTGLAFSTALNILVSSGEDAKLCIWETSGGEHVHTESMQSSEAKTKVQFYLDQVHVLVVHPERLAIYNAANRCFRRQWPMSLIIKERVTDATFSSNGLAVFASFDDGSVGTFNLFLELSSVITPAAYLDDRSLGAYPLTVAAHPAVVAQIALGMSNGDVIVIEPRDAPPPPESSDESNAGSDRALGKAMLESLNRSSG